MLKNLNFILQVVRNCWTLVFVGEGHDHIDILRSYSGTCMENRFVEGLN